MTDLKTLELGQVVDYVIEYNDLHNHSSGTGSKTKTERPTVRKATQADWDAFWG